MPFAEPIAVVAAIGSAAFSVRARDLPVAARLLAIAMAVAMVIAALVRSNGVDQLLAVALVLAAVVYAYARRRARSATADDAHRGVGVILMAGIMLTHGGASVAAGRHVHAEFGWVPYAMVAGYLVWTVCIAIRLARRRRDLPSLGESAAMALALAAMTWPM